MRRARLPVEHATVTEVTPVLRAAHGDGEWLGPITLGRERIVDCARLGGLAVGARLIFRAELDVALFDL